MSQTCVARRLVLALFSTLALLTLPSCQQQANTSPFDSLSINAPASWDVTFERQSEPTKILGFQVDSTEVVFWNNSSHTMIAVAKISPESPSMDELYETLEKSSVTDLGREATDTADVLVAKTDSEIPGLPYYITIACSWSSSTPEIMILGRIDPSDSAEIKDQFAAAWEDLNQALDFN